MSAITPYGPVLGAPQYASLSGDSFTTTGSSSWIRFQAGALLPGQNPAAGNVILRITGTASSATVQVNTSLLGPVAGVVSDSVPAAAVVTGNPSTGINPVLYIEAAIGWWQYQVTAVSGGTCVPTLMGPGA